MSGGGWWVLAAVRRDNAAARERERERVEAEAASDPKSTGVREGLPVSWWRGLR